MLDQRRRDGRRNRTRPSAGWLPRQHGAWFMLALPVVVGWIVRVRDGAPAAPQLVPLVACWIAGYLAFNAAIGWLKAPARRRPAALRPLLAYSLLTIACGAISLAMVGPALLAWLVPFAPLVAAALLLAATRRERSLASGALTVAAASLMVLVTRFITADELLRHLGTPAGTTALVHTGLVFGYLFGTVLHVKGMIRERGRRGWVALSVGWHLALTAATGLAAALGTLAPGWVVLFALTAARAWLLPAVAARRPVRPLVVGLVEIGLTTAFVVVTALG